MIALTLPSLRLFLFSTLHDSCGQCRDSTIKLVDLGIYSITIRKLHVKTTHLDMAFGGSLPFGVLNFEQKLEDPCYSPSSTNEELIHQSYRSTPVYWYFYVSSSIHQSFLSLHLKRTKYWVIYSSCSSLLTRPQGQISHVYFFTPMSLSYGYTGLRAQIISAKLFSCEWVG